MGKEKTPFMVRHVDVETALPIGGKMTGEFPDWLEGALIRNGSGVYHFGKTTVNHIFDGMAVVHRFEISQGKATYQNRILLSDSYLKSEAEQRLMVMQFGTRASPDPCKSLLGRFMSHFEMLKPDQMTDNCNVNVCYYGDELYAITESPNLQRIDPSSLDSEEKVNVSEYVAVNAVTAHPHVGEDGTVYNMGNAFGPDGASYNIVEFPPGKSVFKEAKIVATIPCRWKLSQAYYHSFGMTDNYFVFIEIPLRLNFLKAAAVNMTGSTISSCMEYYPDERSRFVVIDRRTGENLKTVYEAPSFMTFHHANAYEKDGHLIVDLCEYKDASILYSMTLKKLSSTKQKFACSTFTRYVLPLNVKPPQGTKQFKEQYGTNLVKLQDTKCISYWKNKKVMICKPDHISLHGIELPRINYQYNGKYYRYVYGIHATEGNPEPLQMIKIDAETRKVQFWERQGYAVSEPVFIARPQATEEDDGYILFSALDRFNSKRVMLVLLDASTFKEVATVEFATKGTVSSDYHGLFAAKGDLVHRY